MGWDKLGTAASRTQSLLKAHHARSLGTEARRPRNQRGERARHPGGTVRGRSPAPSARPPAPSPRRYPLLFPNAAAVPLSATPARPPAARYRGDAPLRRKGAQADPPADSARVAQWRLSRRAEPPIAPEGAGRRLAARPCRLWGGERRGCRSGMHVRPRGRRSSRNRAGRMRFSRAAGSSPAAPRPGSVGAAHSARLDSVCLGRWSGLGLRLWPLAGEACSPLSGSGCSALVCRRVVQGVVCGPVRRPPPACPRWRRDVLPSAWPANALSRTALLEARNSRALRWRRPPSPLTAPLPVPELPSPTCSPWWYSAACCGNASSASCCWVCSRTL